MKRVLFFIENGWAFGTIHHGLCKELYKHNIYANLLDWSVQYTSEEISFLNSTYDIFVTIPNMADVLIQNYHINPNKIILIAHEQTDILITLQRNGKEYFKQFKEYGVISKILKDKSKEVGIEIEPKIVKTAIHFDHLYAPVSQQLTTVGYGGAKFAHNFYGVDRKRGHLVEECVSRVKGLSLRPHKFYNHLCVPAYYKEIDCLVMSSLEDAGGLPTMEAAAAGRLVIGTPVGYFETCGPEGGGVVVPINEQDFVTETTNHLNFYKDNPKEYIEKCEQIQQYARDHYDWSVRISDWLNII